MGLRRIKKMKIISGNKSAWLEIGKAKNGEDLHVELKDGELSARATVYGYMADSFPDLFRFMKENWKGWSGEKSWGSLEGQLDFKSSMDKLGHITLLVYLCPDPQLGWEVRSKFSLEPSQLDTLFEEARSLFPNWKPG
jgi:Family of unknown function (DUF6228)